ncbi:GNAT family N-acetyltransferase [Lentzea sp. HUAS12]|uniref:GNAT family N-acetyltransferase n=1 Tax=Lentzea sp. HUAS12 TaxID=2951806 RepID=UPI00209D976F|nr:GNAT family N-acetyltransferase [Lentzea sp. HUAS12]USX55493.1 GNAT family N-acetyltransferase [Lentzea sp. HUAS12]
MTRSVDALRIEWPDDPAAFFRRHAEVLTGIGATAFAQPEPVMRQQVADRFAKATLAQILRVDGEIVGFGLFNRLEQDLWVVEGRAITPAHQRGGLGTRCFREFVDTTGANAVATVTRNPAVCRMMAAEFRTVLPDLASDRPLRTLHHPGIATAVRSCAAHLGADAAGLPFIRDRYPGGLYGVRDPGLRMPLPEISRDPSCGIITAGVAR